MNRGKLQRKSSHLRKIGQDSEGNLKITLKKSLDMASAPFRKRNTLQDKSIDDENVQIESRLKSHET